MPEEREASSLLFVAGFFGALALAALVLILQKPTPFEKPLWFWNGHVNFDLIVGLVSLAVAASLFASTSVLDITGGRFSWDSPLATFGTYAFVGAFFALLVVLPLLLFPFSPRAGEAMVVIELLLLGVYLFAYLKTMHANRS